MKININEKINKRELLYEILLSKGVGKLTDRASYLIYLLCQKAMKKTSNKDYDNDYDDYLQNAYLTIYNNWWKFNPDVTNNAFAYYTEMHKRAILELYNILYDFKGLTKTEQKNIKTISINSSNNGQGLFNL